MAEKNTTTTTVEQPDVVKRAKGFWDKYSKPIIYIGSAFILLIGGWYAYKNFIVLPKEKKASELIFPAENLFDKIASTNFNKDSVNTVLNGGSLNGAKVTGILSIISNYGGTKSGNRAKFIAGASYLQIQEFDKAIKYLKDFDADGATQIKSRAYGMMGDASVEFKKNDDALEYYKKAADVDDNDEYTFSDFLFRAALFAESTGNKI